MTQIVLQERRHRSGTWLKGLALAGLMLGASVVAHAQTGWPTSPQKLPAIPLRAGMHLIKAEVAQTPREQQIGLMNRSSMGINEGMLFVFPQASKQCFWMKNTLIPLAIAFVADDGSIVNIDEMQPQTENNHCSAKPVRFVLEMNKGWFAKRGIKEGDKLAGGPFSPTP